MPERIDSHENGSRQDLIEHDLHHDGIDRRGFLKCMAWAGTGLVCTLSGGILHSYALADSARMKPALAKADFTFVQISDSHIGFSKEANKDVVGTLQAAVSKILALPSPPPFLLHTGDLSHLSKPAEFDTLDQVLSGAGFDHVHYVPGEHDVLVDNGVYYRDRYGKGTKGDGWYSFDYNGVHFIGLVNVLNLKAGGLGFLGQSQLDWLAQDVAQLGNSTPIVVFAHIPLWTVYPEWGWGTDDSAQALTLLKRFGSVTVLNGHIHQTMQKIEGNITFHTAMSTAFPQPSPGAAAGPGPLKVSDDRLQALLGITRVNYSVSASPLAVIDTPLQATTAQASASITINIDNFMFMPMTQPVAAGSIVTWINKDDIPHTVRSIDGKFSSPPLDTGDHFTYRFTTPGTYAYYCSIHPTMTATIVVK
ncbi:MAG: metallophosphoesterase [Capsulimonadaceae bacterium]|nr:metallophosphoesterase [Capsulimonadaceae bacterium]